MALLLISLVVGAVGLSRLGGVVVDGSVTPFHLGGIALEVTIAVLAVVFYSQARGS